MSSNEKPRTITLTPEGLMSTRVEADGSLSAASDKPIAISLDQIRSVGIDNVVDVEIHEISRLFNSTSHYIRFFDGGEVRFAYNNEGTLLELRTRDVTLAIENGERIVLMQKG